MEVPNYRPIYGPVTNGLGTGLLGTAAATITNVTTTPCNPSQSYTYSKYPSVIDAYNSENIISNCLQSIVDLKEENEALKNKLDLLEIQFKFLLNKFTELEEFMESRKGS